MSENPQRIFVAPLDWGLGHATRCIPVIDVLLAKGHEVILGGDGRSLKLLKDHYPGLAAVELPAYGVVYSPGESQVLTMAKQVPRILGAIREENQALKEIIQKNRIDLLISDNRYGLWSKDVLSVFICHELNVMLPQQLNLLQKLVFPFHRSFIQRFDCLWIPDFGGVGNLSGELAHGLNLPAHSRYIGPLSRFGSDAAMPVSFSHSQLQPEQVDIVAILSGPEPQRSLLEEKIASQTGGLQRKVLIVQGKTEEHRFEQKGLLSRISFFNQADLRLLFHHAKVVISRPGYSSLMDYQALGLKQMILVATPGQTEQEYLAHRLDKEGVAFSIRQKHFHLAIALKQVRAYRGFEVRKKPGYLLEKALDALGL